MAQLIYTALMSLDGYIADKHGNFDWAEPDEEVHSFINELARGDGTYLYGRRMYEVMAAWQTVPMHRPAFIADFANLWRAADKVVYSKTLKTASTPRTHIEQQFATEAIQRMKTSSARDLAIGGPTLAAHAFKDGLIDVCHLFIAPVIVGAGNPALPSDIHLELALQDERRFRNGTCTTAQRQAAPPKQTLQATRFASANSSCVRLSFRFAGRFVVKLLFESRAVLVDRWE